jgi:hypothetical protein
MKASSRLGDAPHASALRRIITCLESSTPPAPQEVFHAMEAFTVPEGHDVFALALASIFSAPSDRVTIQQLSPDPDAMPSEHLTACDVVAAALRANSGTPGPALSLSYTTVIPSSSGGLSRFPFQVPHAISRGLPVLGRRGLPNHCTTISISLGIAGSLLPPRQMYFGAHANIAVLSGFLVWLFWPHTPENMARMRRYWTHHDPFDVMDAVVNLSGLSVLVTRSPMAFVLRPLDIHCVLILESSVHVSGPVWPRSLVDRPFATESAFPSLHALAKMASVLSMVQSHSASEDLSHILPYAKETLVQCQSLLHKGSIGRLGPGDAVIHHNHWLRWGEVSAAVDKLSARAHVHH